uniref:Uncharacterized protein n=1 Tax=Trichogramma kaykai TaxID=54128 RepID=A0ABD2VXM6_9HYME
MLTRDARAKRERKKGCSVFQSSRADRFARAAIILQRQRLRCDRTYTYIQSVRELSRSTAPSFNALSSLYRKVAISKKILTIITPCGLFVCVSAVNCIIIIAKRRKAAAAAAAAAAATVADCSLLPR